MRSLILSTHNGDSTLNSSQAQYKRHQFFSAFTAVMAILNYVYCHRYPVTVIPTAYRLAGQEALVAVVAR